MTTTPSFSNRVTELLGVEIPIALELDAETNAMDLFGNAMEGAVALSGEVAGRIDEVRPVADIISECAADCLPTIADLARRCPT